MNQIFVRRRQFSQIVETELGGFPIMPAGRRRIGIVRRMLGADRDMLTTQLWIGHTLIFDGRDPFFNLAYEPPTGAGQSENDQQNVKFVHYSLGDSAGGGSTAGPGIGSGSDTGSGGASTGGATDSSIGAGASFVFVASASVSSVAKLDSGSSTASTVSISSISVTASISPPSDSDSS